MENDKQVLDFYRGPGYILKNPSLHQEDTHWKIIKIKPLIDRLFYQGDLTNQDVINLLDIGGGAGLILRGISSYIENCYNKKVNKFALDVSPEMVNIQRQNNPDLKVCLNEDIRETSLGDKQIDVALMIDTLEHIPEPLTALSEVRRISKYAIFKVPLENNLEFNALNFISRGRQRRKSIENLGHINVYNSKCLRRDLENIAGEILEYGYTNVSEYYNNTRSTNTVGSLNSLIFRLGKKMNKVSPGLTSWILYDFMMVLLRCYD
jgi:ubiquinone/menaquinone biosynthesis C-methylase UbiE